MRVFCDLPGRPGAWERAGWELGHRVTQGGGLVAIRALNPDVVLLGPGTLDDPGVKRWLDGHPHRWAMFEEYELPVNGHAKIRLVVFDREPVTGPSNAVSLKPCVEPGPGRYRPELACGAAYVGPFRAELVKPLAAACRTAPVRIYSPDPWPLANWVGELPRGEWRDAMASAAVCLDPLGDDELALEILAAGGRCASGKPRRATGLNCLDAVPAVDFSVPDWLEKAADSPRPDCREELATNTYVARLREILSRFAT